MFAQNFDKLNKKEAFTLTGGLNYNAIVYDASGITARRDPFNWYFSGNITATVLDVSLPFTYNYTNRKSSYTQPFNIQSFTPSYKWIKGYAGFTSMNFSPYTLAGHLFLGGGIELSPGSWKIAGMYGRLEKAVDYSATGSENGLSYKRMGYAAKAGYEKNGHGFSLCWFNAKDDPASLLFVPPAAQLRPQENTAVSISAKTVLWKQLRLESEYARSGLTPDTRIAESVGTPSKNKLPVLFTLKPGSVFFDAVKASLGWQQHAYGLKLGYERIAPGYQSLGAYFFNNDLESFTLSPSAQFAGGKLTASLNTGLQRNNLDGSKLNTTRRWVNAATLSFNPSSRWNFNASYSNFSTFTRQLPQSDPFYHNTLDTLNYYQLAQQASFSALHRFGKKTFPQSIQLFAAYQVTSQFTGAVSDPGLLGNNISGLIPASVLNGNLSWLFTSSRSKTSIALSGNMNRSQMSAGINNLYFGPGFTFAQPVLNNSLRFSAGSTYNRMLVNDRMSGSVLSHRAGITWHPALKNKKAGKISIALNAAYIQQFRIATANGSFREFTGTVGAGYTF